MIELSPQTKHRLSLVGIMILIVGASWLLSDDDTEGYKSTSTKKTTYSYNPYGGQAIYLLAERFIDKVERSHYPFLQLKPELAKGQTIIIFEPSRPISKTSAGRLFKWIESGGQLILASHLDWPIGADTKLDEQTKKIGDFLDQKDVESKQMFAELGIKIKIEHKTKQKTLHDLFLEELQDDVEAEEQNEAELDALNKAKGNLRLKNSFRAAKFKPVFGSKKRMLIGNRKYGKGRILFIPDSEFLTNGRIKDTGNAYWLLQRVAAWGQHLLFDEFYQGYSEKRGTLGLTFQFLGTPWGFILIQLLVAGLLYFLFHGIFLGNHYVVFGRNRSVKNRPALPLVQARAGFMKRSRAYSFATYYLYRAFYRDWFRKSNLSSETHGSDSFDFLKPYFADNQFERLVSLIRAAKKDEIINENEVYETARLLAQAESKIYEKEK